MAKKPVLKSYDYASKVIDKYIRKTDHIESLQQELDTIRPEVEELVFNKFHEFGFNIKTQPENFILSSHAGQLECQLQKKKGNSPLSSDDVEFLKTRDLPYDTTTAKVSYDLSKSLQSSLTDEVRTDINDLINQYLTLKGLPVIENPIERNEGNPKYVVTDTTLGELYAWATENNTEFNELTTAVKRVGSLHIHPTLTETEIVE